MRRILTSALVIMVMALPLAAQENKSFGKRIQDNIYFSGDMADFLSRVEGAERFQLKAFPMPDGTERAVTLRPFEVFADGAYISVREGDVEVERREAPQTRYYKGHIDGDAGSLVFVRVTADGMVKSMVRTEGEMYFMASMEGYPSDLRVEPALEVALKQGPREFTCETIPSPSFKRGEVDRTVDIQQAISANGSTATVAIETDYELYQKFGSVSGMTNYIGDLFGVINTIYNRDVDVQLDIGTIISYTSSNDPWKASNTSGALSEFERYWRRNNGNIDRTVAHQLSGRNLGGGIAYVGAICNNQYGFGVSAIDGNYNVSTFDTWDIVVVAHELGHNFGSGHTHDYNPPIDTCTSGNLPSGGGTIMSYCHLLTGGMSNINLEFHPRVQGVIGSTIDSSGSCMNSGSGGNTTTDTFSDTVGANQTNSHTINVTGGTIDLTLNWNGGGNLDLYLFDPSGSQVASNTSNKPVTISYATSTSGTYTIEVRNQRNKNKGYSLTATYED